jgi:transcription antitermination factor NusB
MAKKASMGKRRRAREMAVQMLYQQEMGGSNVEQVFQVFDLDDFLQEAEFPVADAAETKPAGDEPPAPPPPPPPRPPSRTSPLGIAARAAAAADTAERRKLARDSFEHAQRLVRGTLAEGSVIDELIREHAENWRLERMPPIDRNILRLAIYEMLFEGSVPKVVVVDEAIELAKRFGSENSGRFVNGLLDGVLKSRSFEKIAATRAEGGALMQGKAT